MQGEIEAYSRALSLLDLRSVAKGTFCVLYPHTTIQHISLLLHTVMIFMFIPILLHAMYPYFYLLSPYCHIQWNTLNRDTLGHRVLSPISMCL